MELGLGLGLGLTLTLTLTLTCRSSSVRGAMFLMRSRSSALVCAICGLGF